MNSVAMSVKAVRGISHQKKFSLKLCQVFSFKSLICFESEVYKNHSTGMILLETCESSLSSLAITSQVHTGSLKGVNWKLGFAYLSTGKMRFEALGPGFGNWERKKRSE